MMSPVEAVMPDFCSRRSPLHYTTALIALMRLNVDLSRVDLQAIGEHENYRGEIRYQEPQPGTRLDSRTRITLKIGFPSAVDHMPYQFFYGLGGVRSSTGKWEDDARCLMSPFDAAVIRHRAAAKFRDLKSGLGLVDSKQVSDFLSVFEYAVEAESTELREALIWAAVLPTFNQWGANAEGVCRVLERLFGYKFEIRENVESQHEIPSSCRYRLGSPKDRLGEGVILGKTFTDYDSAYEVLVKDVPVESVSDFLPGGRIRKRIERALEICMPGNLEYSIRVRAIGPMVAIGKGSKRNYLGYTSYIGT
ncbi:MAG: type VI secretion system baseplate subunit TssG [Candidatus Zixiibacteriota bacterium]